MTVFHDFSSSAFGKIVKKGNDEIGPYFILFLALDLVKPCKKVMRKFPIFHAFSGSELDKNLKNGDERIRSYFTYFQDLDLAKL